MWILTLNTSLSIVFSFFVLSKGKAVFAQIRPNAGILITIGFVNALALYIQMIALTITLVSCFIAVKRLSVILTVLYDFLCLKEKGIKRRLSGIILMVLGVFLISFS